MFSNGYMDLNPSLTGPKFSLFDQGTIGLIDVILVSFICLKDLGIYFDQVNGLCLPTWIVSTITSIKGV